MTLSFKSSRLSSPVKEVSEIFTLAGRSIVNGSFIIDTGLTVHTPSLGRTRPDAVIGVTLARHADHWLQQLQHSAKVIEWSRQRRVDGFGSVLNQRKGCCPWPDQTAVSGGDCRGAAPEPPFLQVAYPGAVSRCSICMPHSQPVAAGPAICRAQPELCVKEGLWQRGE